MLLPSYNFDGDPFHMDGELLFRHKLFQLSTICPGEVYGGFLARQRDNSAIALVQQLNGHGDIPWIVPSRLEERIPPLVEYTGPVKHVLQYHTLFTGFNRFLSYEDALSLRTSYLGQYSTSSVTLVGLIKNGQRGHAWNPAICLECLQKDVAPGGKTFWRGDLLLSHIRFCPRHATTIYTHCTTCAHGHRKSRSIRSPDSVCICGNRLRAREHVSNYPVQHLELDIARAWSRLLDPEFAPHMQGPEFLTLVSQKARSLGLANDQSVNWKHFYEIFHAPAIAALGESLAFPFRTESVAYALRGKAMIRNPIHAIFLLLMLFGAWDDVEAAIHDPAKIPAPQPSQRPAVSENNHRPRHYERHRAKRYERSMALLPETIKLYQQIRDANPHLSHTAIVLALPDQNRYGLTAEILRAHGLTDMPLRFGQVNTAAMDASGADHIERRYKELVENGARFRITTSRLLYGHEMRYSWGVPLARANYPATDAALEKYRDTQMTRMRRVLRIDLLAGKFRRFGPADAERIPDMTDLQVVRLWRKCNRRSRAKPR
ncbi:hypothetical protein SAMN05445504_3724 [Burkholderia sp. CF099]|nr:hypothetical protein SAMN05445504_3724 [Burkholderia sp. CF099]